MKKLFLLLALTVCYSVSNAQTAYNPAIATYSVMVDSDIIDAFAPRPDSASTDKDTKAYFKDYATSLKTGYKTYEAYLTDTCYKIIAERLKTKYTIVLGEKVPKEGAFSYTNYGYPQMGFKKAIKSGVASQYIKIEVKFTYKESFMASSSSSSAPKDKMTPLVKISIDLVDNTDKDLAGGKGEAISTTTVPVTNETIYLANKTTSGASFRAPEEIRRTLLLELFDKAWAEFEKNYNEKK